MPEVAAKLPLDSPLWARLSACYSAEKAIARLREIVATRQLGEAWSGLCDEMLHQGSVYGVSSAAIPHLIDVAPHLPAASRGDLWIEIGFLITAGADRFPCPPAPGLQEGVTAALGAAEALAVRDFLADADRPSSEDSYYALACVALAGHPVGRAMWQFPSATQVTCDWTALDAGPRTRWTGSPTRWRRRVLRRPSGRCQGSTATWRDAATAIERSGRGQVLGPGWDDFFDTARQVALAGVPPASAAGSRLVPGCRDGRDQIGDAAPWARTLARLAGHFRCPGCDRVWTIADAMGDEAGPEPVSVTDESGPGRRSFRVRCSDGADGGPQARDPAASGRRRSPTGSRDSGRPRAGRLAARGSRRACCGGLTAARSMR